ncbi:MAG: hypothetical protein ISS01_03135 [Nanoarchaeota archaeon]|nr:hypothetical protein [Nanoarchaeota archaeon]
MKKLLLIPLIFILLISFTSAYELICTNEISTNFEDNKYNLQLDERSGTYEYCNIEIEGITSLENVKVKIKNDQSIEITTNVDINNAMINGVYVELIKENKEITFNEYGANLEVAEGETLSLAINNESYISITGKTESGEITFIKDKYNDLNLLNLITTDEDIEINNFGLDNIIFNSYILITIPENLKLNYIEDFIYLTLIYKTTSQALNLDYIEIIDEDSNVYILEDYQNTNENNKETSTFILKNKNLETYYDEFKIISLINNNPFKFYKDIKTNFELKLNNEDTVTFNILEDEEIGEYITTKIEVNEDSEDKEQILACTLDDDNKIQFNEEDLSTLGKDTTFELLNYVKDDNQICEATSCYFTKNEETKSSYYILRCNNNYPKFYIEANNMNDLSYSENTWECEKADCFNLLYEYGMPFVTMWNFNRQDSKNIFTLHLTESLIVDTIINFDELIEEVEDTSIDSEFEGDNIFTLNAATFRIGHLYFLPDKNTANIIGLDNRLNFISMSGGQIYDKNKNKRYSLKKGNNNEYLIRTNLEGNVDLIFCNPNCIDNTDAITEYAEMRTVGCKKLKGRKTGSYTVEEAFVKLEPAETCEANLETEDETDKVETGTGESVKEGTTEDLEEEEPRSKGCWCAWDKYFNNGLSKTQCDANEDCERNQCTTQTDLPYYMCTSGLKDQLTSTATLKSEYSSQSTRAQELGYNIEDASSRSGTSEKEEINIEESCAAYSNQFTCTNNNIYVCDPSNRGWTWTYVDICPGECTTGISDTEGIACTEEYGEEENTDDTSASDCNEDNVNKYRCGTLGIYKPYQIEKCSLFTDGSGYSWGIDTVACETNCNKDEILNDWEDLCEENNAIVETREFYCHYNIDYKTDNNLLFVEKPLPGDYFFNKREPTDCFNQKSTENYCNRLSDKTCICEETRPWLDFNYYKCNLYDQ